MSVLHPPAVSPARDRTPSDDAPPSRPPSLFARGLGWCWRIAVGALFCTNYLTALFVVGWLFRRSQGVTLRRWWKASRPDSRGTSFEAFCDRLGPDAPAVRPRWFIEEHPREVLTRPGPHGEPGRLRVFLRALRLPFGSLLRNGADGVRALFGTVVLVGWGCLLMTFGWEFGWLNSFHKGYEQHFLGALVTLLGMALFVLAMLYVPMAQAHAAAVGELRGFLDLRLIARLVRAKLGAYTLLAAGTALLALPLEIMKTLPRFFEQMDPWFETATDAELLAFLKDYTIAQGLVLFVTLVVLRGWAARVYAAAVLAALRRGTVKAEDLHPRLLGWLERLRLPIEAEPSPGGWSATAKAGGGWLVRRALWVGLVVIWLAFAAKVFVGEFFNYHPLVGFLNHPLIELPCVDYIPGALKEH